MVTWKEASIEEVTVASSCDVCEVTLGVNRCNGLGVTSPDGIGGVWGGNELSGGVCVGNDPIGGV